MFSTNILSVCDVRPAVEILTPTVRALEQHLIVFTWRLDSKIFKLL